MTMLKYIDEIDIKGKTVLVRVDFNVPLDDQGNITSDNRIKGALPTITYALDKGAKVILMSHLGRPKGKVVESMSLKPAARRLSELLEKDVAMAPDCVGPDVERMAKQMKPGDVMLLENLRFYPEEEKNDEGFAKKLAALADVYVDDAFACAHRAHASVHAITKFVDTCVGGLLMKNEVTYFDKAVTSPAHPVVAILGGAKVSDKIGAVVNLLSKVDKLIIGGAMASTFLAATGCNVGDSKIEADRIDKARQTIEKAEKMKVKLLLPVDAVVADKFEAQANTKVVPVKEIPEHWMILDIGPETTKLFTEALKDAKTIIWNGPVGAFEMEPFSHGTSSIVSCVAGSSALTILGGGDTERAVKKAGVSSKISYISTGGGAFIELLEGKKLPGIEALETKV
jgi:phosphoglycerate kinase